MRFGTEEEAASGDLEADAEESCGENPGGNRVADCMVKQQRRLSRDQLFPFQRRCKSSRLSEHRGDWAFVERGSVGGGDWGLRHVCREI